MEAGNCLASLLVLAGILAAIARGASTSRWGPAAAFSAFWFGGASYIVLGETSLRRRAARLRGATVPLSVRLTQPLWIPLIDACGCLGFGGALGAGAAAIGYPLVGVGMALSVIPIAYLLLFHSLEHVALTFEASRLRVHLRHGDFELPWTAVTEANLGGVPRVPMANLILVAPKQLFETLIPNTRKSRMDLQVLLTLGRPSGQAIAFPGWTAGLDGATIVRAVRDLKGPGKQEPPSVC